VLDAVLEAVELPAGVADLDPGLADVDADDLPHLVRPSASASALPPSPRAAVSLALGRGLPPISPSASLSLLPKCVRSGDKKGGRRREREGRGEGVHWGGNWKRLLLQQPALFRGRCSREPAGPPARCCRPLT
jgi:hypothetical protein